MRKQYLSIKVGLTLAEIDSKYLPDKYSFLNTSPPENKTKILDLNTPSVGSNTNEFSFMDESKTDHSCVITMDCLFTESRDIAHIHCFWCRSEFSYKPISCPIDYIPHRLLKSYHSEITKDKYLLRESVSNHQVHVIQQTSREGMGYLTTNTSVSVQMRDYYLVDGIFCSFNCCLSFIKDNKTNPLYCQSENFLMKIFFDIFGNNISPPKPAPSWRLLKKYGGHLTIEEYRKNFYKVEYIDIDNIMIPFPSCKPIGIVFEKKVKI